MKRMPKRGLTVSEKEKEIQRKKRRSCVVGKISRKNYYEKEGSGRSKSWRKRKGGSGSRGMMKK